jgi:hypothetical protein
MLKALALSGVIAITAALPASAANVQKEPQVFGSSRRRT